MIDKRHAEQSAVFQPSVAVIKMGADDDEYKVYMKEAHKDEEEKKLLKKTLRQKHRKI